MSIYDIITLGLVAIVVVTFIILLIRGKREVSNSSRYIILVLVVITLVSVISIFHYYKRLLAAEINRVEELQLQLLEVSDSLIFTQDEKQYLISDLKKVEGELNEILQRMHKQGRIVGLESGLVEGVEDVKEVASNRIYEIEKFNEVINNNLFRDVRKGMTYSGNTSAFTFHPPLRTNGDYLDFLITFHDESIIDKIAVIYIEVYTTKDDGNRVIIYDQYYMPQYGVNAFRLKNYFGDSSVAADFGFFWKDDFGKSDYPRYEKVTYSNI